MTRACILISPGLVVRWNRAASSLSTNSRALTSLSGRVCGRATVCGPFADRGCASRNKRLYGNVPPPRASPLEAALSPTLPIRRECPTPLFGTLLTSELRGRPVCRILRDGAGCRGVYGTARQGFLPMLHDGTGGVTGSHVPLWPFRPRDHRVSIQWNEKPVPRSSGTKNPSPVPHSRKPW